MGSGFSQDDFDSFTLLIKSRQWSSARDFFKRDAKSIDPSVKYDFRVTCSYSPKVANSTYPVNILVNTDLQPGQAELLEHVFSPTAPHPITFNDLMKSLKKAAPELNLGDTEDARFATAPFELAFRASTYNLASPSVTAKQTAETPSADMLCRVLFFLAGVREKPIHDDDPTMMPRTLVHLQQSRYRNNIRDWKFPKERSEFITNVLMLAVVHRGRDVKLFREIISHLSDDDMIENSNGVFHVIAEKDTTGELIRELVSSGRIPPYMRNAEGENEENNKKLYFEALTPLMLAAREGNIEFIKECVANKIGGDIRLTEAPPSDSGINALHLAARMFDGEKSAEMVQVLLSLPGSSEAKDAMTKDQCNTPITFAIERKNKKTFEILLSNGCKEELPPLRRAPEGQETSSRGKYTSFEEFVKANIVS